MQGCSSLSVQLMTLKILLQVILVRCCSSSSALRGMHSLIERSWKRSVYSSFNEIGGTNESRGTWSLFSMDFIRDQETKQESYSILVLCLPAIIDIAWRVAATCKKTDFISGTKGSINNWLFFYIYIYIYTFKRKPKTLGSMTGSSIIPFVNPTWIISGLQNAKEWLEVTDIRVKQTVCSSEGGDITQGNDIPLNFLSMQY